MWRLDQRSSPELYVGDLLARFAEREPERTADLRAFAERAHGGQVEDALIDLLALPPREAVATLLRWRDEQLRAGAARPLVQRRLESFRRLATLVEREFMDVSLLAALQERHGATFAQLLAKELATSAPS